MSNSDAVLSKMLNKILLELALEGIHFEGLGAKVLGEGGEDETPTLHEILIEARDSYTMPGGSVEPSFYEVPNWRGEGKRKKPRLK